MLLSMNFVGIKLCQKVGIPIDGICRSQVWGSQTPGCLVGRKQQSFWDKPVLLGHKSFVDERELKESSL